MSHNNRNKIDFDMLAELSKLEFDECEKEKLKEELEEFLLFIDHIKNVDCAECGDTEGECQKYNVFREDVVCNQCYSSELMLSNVKTCSDGYITVPRVVEGSDND